MIRLPDRHVRKGFVEFFPNPGNSREAAPVQERVPV